jgi:uncharacterized damage-inducible protein DinB
MESTERQVAMALDLTRTVRSALVGELEQLRDQVKELVSRLTEQQLWAKPIEPGNSVGHLILHLTGNLNHFVGGQLGKTGYVRDREREFSESNPPTKADLLAGLDEAAATFRQVVMILEAEEFAQPHPEDRLGIVLSALVHLVAHFALHRGQMSYIVRMLKQ